MKILAIHPFILIDAMPKHLCQTSSHTDLPCKAFAQGTGIWGSNSQVKEGSSCCSYCQEMHLPFNPTKRFQKVSLLLPATSNHTKSPLTLAKGSALLSDTRSHNITALRLEKNFSQQNLPHWIGADPEADWMQFFLTAWNFYPLLSHWQAVL